MLKVLLFISSLFFAAFSYGAPKALFGQDNRIESRMAPREFQELRSGVAIMIPEPFYEELENFLRLDFSPLGEDYGLCSDERFVKQPTASINCTGFLVAEDLLVTAGHCMVNWGEARDTVTPQCSDFHWLFDFEVSEQGAVNLEEFPKENLFKCEKVIFATFETADGNEFGKDFALIKLKRKAEGRKIQPLSETKPRAGQKLSILGHPSGLPMKFADQGNVTRTQFKNYFEAAIDSSGGNSGSPVYDKKGEVLGILVRGPEDFVEDKKKNCDRWNRCLQSGLGCKNPEDRNNRFNRGMHMQRLNPVKELLQLEFSKHLKEPKL